jgi:diguanylate cyclase
MWSAFNRFSLVLVVFASNAAVMTAHEIAFNVGSGLFGVFVGAALVLLWVQMTAASDAPPDDQPAAQAQPSAHDANQAARAHMAVDQVRTLAEAVACDLGEHTALVGGCSEQLAGIQLNADDLVRQVSGIIVEMLEANGKLNRRLADAERKIQSQAVELRAQHIDATTDALTALPNRRAFDAFLAEQIRQKAEQDTTFSLLFFDLDHFKQLNDLHGHLAGDAVLQVMGRTLPQIVKKSDLACRYGGEEFAVVMPQTNCAEAQRIAERLRKAIESLAVPFEGRRLKVTASVGVAEALPGERGLQLMRRADEAVYASKDAGKNCCHYHDGLSCFLVFDPAKSLVAGGAGHKTAAAPFDVPAGNTVQSALGREAFLELLQRRIAERHRTGALLAVAYLRIKNFDEICVKYGDAVGSHVIEVIASFIRSSLRDMDILGRVDNDAVALLLPGNSASAAHIVAERVRASISRCALPLGDRSMRVDLDLGTAEAQPADSSEVLVRRAFEEIESSLETAAAI